MSAMEALDNTQVHRLGKSHAWRTANIIFLGGMGFGSLSYGYTTNVIATTLGKLGRMALLYFQLVRIATKFTW